MHRVLHVPAISEEIVDHFAEDYADVVELSKSDPSKSAIDSDTLQYFAIDVWAFDIAAPGIGCTGELEEESSDSEASATATSSSAASATSEAPKVRRYSGRNTLHRD